MAHKLRIDKWLWAARFFKTRGLAKQAVEGGKVYCNGQRVKVSKEIAVGDVLRVRQGCEEKDIEITGLSALRRGAPDAALLYNETEQSKARRAEQAAMRKAGRLGFAPSDRKPTKKERRELKKFRNAGR